MKQTFYVLLFVILCSSWGTAKNVGVAAFFELLESSPEVQAARASVLAAEAALGQARKPVALDVNAEAQTRSDPLATTAPIANLGTGVTVYPFTYGAQGDLIRTRELELKQARLNYQQTQAQLEAKALRSAFEVELYRYTLALAKRGAAAARQIYNTNQLRNARGVVTVAEVRSAETEVRKKENLVLSHAANLELAEATLTAFVGEARLANLPDLKMPKAIPFSVRNSNIAVQLARISTSGATRAFYPVVNANYNFDLSEQSRVSASISSQDLAPRVGYTYASNGWDDGIRLSVRLSATISPDQFQNVTRLEQLQVAAEANLRAAQRDAAAQEGLLSNRVEDTARSLQLAEFGFENAERSLREVQQREALGITTTLETQQEIIALVNAGASLYESTYDFQRQHFTALLDLYEFYGLPISELLP